MMQCRLKSSERHLKSTKKCKRPSCSHNVNWCHYIYGTFRAIIDGDLLTSFMGMLLSYHEHIP